MRQKSPKALSLFSGAGGLDIGVVQAGFEVLASLEIDKYACETLHAAVQREDRQTRIFEKDICVVDPAELMDELNLVPGELDLLCAGPPCQTFSQIGKQAGIKDDRGLLIFQVTRFARVFKPKAIIFENVKGLVGAKGTQGIKGEVFSLFLADLENLGYAVKWQLLNAADYGVPQARVRVFVVALKGANNFSFPQPTFVPNGSVIHGLGLKPYRTVGDALEGLKHPGNKNGELRCDSHVDVTPHRDRARITGVPEGSFLAAQEHLPSEQRGRLTKKDSTKFLRLSRQKVANTLRCGEIFFHPLVDRYLTPREYMRLHGFPDDYLLNGPIRGRSGSVKNLDQHRQVANSVPPPVARAVAAQVMEALNCQVYSKYSATLSQIGR